MACASRGRSGRGSAGPCSTLPPPCDAAASDAASPPPTCSRLPPAAVTASGRRRDYDARREAGLELTWATAEAVTRATTLESSGAGKTHGFVLDPFRACLGLASAAVAQRKAQIFEHSPVTHVRDRRKHVEVQTDRGLLRAQSVVVATAARFTDLRALRRHLRPRHAYAVVTEPLPVAVRRAVVVSVQPVDPGRRRSLSRRPVDGGSSRPRVRRRPAGRRAAVTARGDRAAHRPVDVPVVRAVPADFRRASGVVLARGVYDSTPDNLPCLGPHRNFPRHFFALGQGRHGDGTSWLAARLATRWVAGAPDKGDELFGFARIL